MPSIVGIDTSLTSTGLCKLVVHKPDIEDSPADYEVDLDKVKSKPKGSLYLDVSVRIGIIVARIDDFAMAEGRPDLVVIEGPAFSSRGQGHHSTAWLWGAVYDQFALRDIPIMVATPSSRMKYATGKGNADKDTVLAAAIRRWPDVPIDGNDTADAFILAAIGARHLGVPIDTVPKANHVGPGKLSA